MDDELFFDGNEFEEQLDLVETEKTKILDSIIEYATKTKEAVLYREKGDESIYYNILKGYVLQIDKLNELVTSDASDEEILRAIKEINLGVDNIGYTDVDRYAQDFRDLNGIDLVETDDTSNNDNDEDDDLGF